MFGLLKKLFKHEEAAPEKKAEKIDPQRKKSRPPQERKAAPPQDRSSRRIAL